METPGQFSAENNILGPAATVAADGDDLPVARGVAPRPERFARMGAYGRVRDGHPLLLSPGGYRGTNKEQTSSERADPPWHRSRQELLGSEAGTSQPLGEGLSVPRDLPVMRPSSRWREAVSSLERKHSCAEHDARLSRNAPAVWRSRSGLWRSPPPFRRRASRMRRRACSPHGRSPCGASATPQRRQDTSEHQSTRPDFPGG